MLQQPVGDPALADPWKADNQQSVPNNSYTSFSKMEATKSLLHFSGWNSPKMAHFNHLCLDSRWSVGLIVAPSTVLMS